MNRETLMAMPISQLRGLDIRTTEDELLVQEVLNEKFQNEPEFNRGRNSNFSSDTDNLTPEKEAALQASLDEDEEISSDDESLEEKIIENVPLVDPLEESKIENDSKVVIEEKKKVFCQFCDAKGPVKHKNNCTRLQANNLT